MMLAFLLKYISKVKIRLQIAVLLGLGILISGHAMGQSPSGPRTSGTQATVDVDNSSWATTGNTALSDGNYTEITTNFLDNIDVSDILQLTNFGFAIPCGNKIDGILVEIERHKVAGSSRDLVVQLNE